MAEDEMVRQRHQLNGHEFEETPGDSDAPVFLPGKSHGQRSLAKSCLTLRTPWTVAHQAPLSMGFPKQECWSGLPFSSPGNPPTQGSNPGLLHCRQSPALQADSLPTEPPENLPGAVVDGI